MNLNCQSAINITTHSAEVRGSADAIPANHFLRIAYGVTSGGPYNTFTTSVPGDTSFGQLYSDTITNLIPDVTYYYVLQELDTDGITILGESDQCLFKTLNYSTTCDLLSFNETSVTVKVCADYVATDQTLDFIWGNNPGGPYPNVGGSVPGEDIKGQCAIFTIPLAPCQIIYYRGSVTKVPATYEVDWSYAHSVANSPAAPVQSMELRIGPEADYPANQTLVDTDVMTYPGDAMTWNVKSGTYPVPLNINQLHLGFVSTSLPGNIGNMIDKCSIILRRVLPSPLVIGEQLINGSFEVPVIPPAPASYTAVPELVGGVAWQTTDPTGLLEYWPSGGTPYLLASYDGVQHVELNYLSVGELFQVVNLAVATADSQECTASTFKLDCAAATNVDCLEANLNGKYCGLPPHYSYQFEYSTNLGGPFTALGPVNFVPSLSGADIPVSTGSGPLNPNTTYYYRIVALDPHQNVIGTSETCSFTTANCIQWCGGWHNPNNCVLVDPGGGEPPYFNCNPV